MRIVAGDFGGRRLQAVPGRQTRPTTDKVKEAVFNIIGPYFDGGRSLDLYAGSGGLSIEAVSRGIQQAVLVDRQYQAIKTIQANLAVTKAQEQFKVLKSDAATALKRLSGQEPFTLVFLDPPYKKQKIVDDIESMLELGLLAKDSRIVCETDQDANLPADLPGFKLLRQQTYGITVITVYQYVGGAA